MEYGLRSYCDVKENVSCLRLILASQFKITFYACFTKQIVLNRRRQFDEFLIADRSCATIKKKKVSSFHLYASFGTICVQIVQFLETQFKRKICQKEC